MRLMSRLAIWGVLGVVALGWTPPAWAQEPAYGTAAAEIAEKIAQAFPKVEGRVIGLERERVLLDLGKKDQVISGLELQVYREGQEFKHPFTGQILGKLDRDVGRIRVVEVQPNFSLAEVIQQAEGTMVQQGDRVRVTSARVILALPNVDVADVAGANVRAVTRDLLNALVKTGRFEVMTDQRIRGALQEEKVPAPDQFTDPATLQGLWKRLRVSAVLMGKLSLLEKGVQWDVQAVSTVRGDSITLASAEVKGVAARPAAGSSSRMAAAAAGRDAPRIDQVALRSQEVPFKGVALAAGELTGDGTTKLAMTDGQHVVIYSLERTGIKEFARIPGSGQDNVIALDVADINGNGIPEIFVTNYAKTGLRSYVLEYKDKKFQRIWSDAALHFRVMEEPGEGPRLYAQTGSPEAAFEGPVRKYAWQGKLYVPGPVVPLPKQFNRIYGFALADLDGDSVPEVLVLDNQDYLRVFDRNGRELYRSGDRYGGSEVTVEFDPERTGGTARAGIDPIQTTIQGRMYYQDIVGEGKKQLIVPRNTPSTGYMWKTRLYDRGKVFGLAWDGIGMQQAWETRDMPGYIADYALIDPEGTGSRKLVLLVVQTNLLGMGGSRSSVIMLDLRP